MIRRTVVVVGAVAFGVFSMVACSSATPSTESEEQQAPLCYLETSPQARGGLVPKSAICQCGGEEEPDTLATSTDTSKGLGDPIAAADIPSSDTPGLMPAALTPMNKDGGILLDGGTKECPTGLCGTKDWTKKKLLELAACVGMVCAGLGGGDGSVTKVVSTLARAVCCAKEPSKYEAAAKDLRDGLAKECAPMEAGVEAGKSDPKPTPRK